MKILLASIPASGHFNPILVAARILKEAGHETAIYNSVVFRDKTEKAGVRFFPLPEDADQGWRDFLVSFFEKHKVTPTSEEMGKGFTASLPAP
jgi:UDP:flavonoid glycosyltransferase YjiC (YdhE family)